ncbi:UNVERIFIED_CONTAM: hypothetical protein RMT77_004082 [Armadillidium vulgare]
MVRLKSIMNIQPNIFMLRYFRTSGSYLLIIFLILYVAYFTSEVCLRIQNINKYERLQSYDIEIKDLTTKLSNFRKDTRNVKKSLSILKDVLKGIIEIHNKSKEHSPLQHQSVEKPKSLEKREIKRNYRRVYGSSSKMKNLR